MLTTLAVILALCITLFIALLAVPVSLTHDIHRRQTWQGEMTVVWLFGLVRIRFSPFQPSSKAKPTAEKSLAKKSSHITKTTKKKTQVTRKRKNAFATLRQKAFRRRIMKFIGDLWRAVHKENIRLRVCIGLGDPADTGQLWAIAGPIAGILASAKEASIEVIPDFLDTTLEVDSSGTVQLIPLQVITLTIGLLVSAPIRQGLWQMRAA